ncbi:transcriptional regulator, AraC family [Paludibacter propionicigenes WB4]|uniref:Transcriptional regulator, AraC family n=1 Tax=Paludibacter propionicigenes (strain DSM 17365 / JCM 13257 / WB4) TaxID=694427 RepID=E4T0C1_PALPW|nr:helix-turn-helix domain-containing protein [Paludibacter propionicigenes]ADQ78175.1 transcriptional regulator, AraC family [Paludibacter propionicigenes WB4]
MSNRNDKQQTVPGILKKLAQLLGTEIIGRRLEIPEKYGKGYCTGFVFNEHIRMIISNYELNEDLVVVNEDIDASKRMIFFKFQNSFPKKEIVITERHVTEMPSVLVATSTINTDDLILIHTNTEVVNIEIDATYLNELFDLSGKSPVLQSLLQNTQPLLFEQMIYPSLQRIVDEIVNEPIDPAFELFYRRVKAEELICRLLMELEKRDEQQLYALNALDIQALYKVKEQMLMHLETPPIINTLAALACMSPSKLKRLFKQIFGNSIFSYYQEFRIQEAARLLKEEKLSVSDAGYRMGFTNLSHFSRVFEEHLGMKPKQYSRS